MTDILDDEIHAEGGYRNDPNDPGGETQFGLTRRDNPKEWADGVVTHQEARDAYQHRFLDGWKIGFIPFEPLKHQVLDFCINSGYWGIYKLQMLLGLKQDGVIGPATLAAIAKSDPRVINNRLVDERILFICRVVQKNPKQIGDLFGLVSRALTFRLP